MMQVSRVQFLIDSKIFLNLSKIISSLTVTLEKDLTGHVIDPDLVNNFINIRPITIAWLRITDQSGIDLQKLIWIVSSQK